MNEEVSGTKYVLCVYRPNKKEPVHRLFNSIDEMRDALERVLINDPYTDLVTYYDPFEKQIMAISYYFSVRGFDWKVAVELPPDPKDYNQIMLADTILVCRFYTIRDYIKMSD